MGMVAVAANASRINHPAKGQAPPEGITPLGILRMMARACDGAIFQWA